MPGVRAQEFPPSELNLLWYLKRHGGSVSRREGTGESSSLYSQISYDLHCGVGTVRYAAKQLEKKSLVIRTHLKFSPKMFTTQGHNPLVKLEMVDPNMWLPPAPSMPLAVVLAKENEELEERIEQDPSEVDVIMALVDRVHELEEQVNKLQICVIEQSEENERLKKQRADRPKTHLSQPVMDALPPDVWEALKRKGRS